MILASIRAFAWEDTQGAIGALEARAARTLVCTHKKCVCVCFFSSLSHLLARDLFGELEDRRLDEEGAPLFFGVAASHAAAAAPPAKHMKRQAIASKHNKGARTRAFTASFTFL